MSIIGSILIVLGILTAVHAKRTAQPVKIKQKEARPSRKND